MNDYLQQNYLKTTFHHQGIIIRRPSSRTYKMTMKEVELNRLQSLIDKYINQLQQQRYSQIISNICYMLQQDKQSIKGPTIFLLHIEYIHLQNLKKIMKAINLKVLSQIKSKIKFYEFKHQNKWHDMLLEIYLTSMDTDPSYIIVFFLYYGVSMKQQYIPEFFKTIDQKVILIIPLVYINNKYLLCSDYEQIYNLFFIKESTLFARFLLKVIQDPELYIIPSIQILNRMYRDFKLYPISLEEGIRRYKQCMSLCLMNKQNVFIKPQKNHFLGLNKLTIILQNNLRHSKDDLPTQQKVLKAIIFQKNSYNFSQYFKQVVDQSKIDQLRQKIAKELQKTFLKNFRDLLFHRQVKSKFKRPYYKDYEDLEDQIGNLIDYAFTTKIKSYQKSFTFSNLEQYNEVIRPDINKQIFRDLNQNKEEIENPVKYLFSLMMKQKDQIDIYKMQREFQKKIKKGFWYATNVLKLIGIIKQGNKKIMNTWKKQIYAKSNPSVQY